MMMSEKQLLLKQHRQKKRIVVAIAAFGVILSGVLFFWWLPFPLAIVGFVIHEVWLSDHQFYASGQDYQFEFPESAIAINVVLQGDGRLVLSRPVDIALTDTVILAVSLSATLLGRVLDPSIVLSDGHSMHTQTFERSTDGLRYLNLTGFSQAILDSSLNIGARYCRFTQSGRLWIFKHPDFLQKRLLVVAPHADDAELAAFGMYSQAKEVWLVTLSAGEIEAGKYKKMTGSSVAAAFLKGRLRAWDSVVVPRWARIPGKHCFQLGYFCLQFPAMQASPELPIGSREAALFDTRPFRIYNETSLPGDANGLPTWNMLKEDLYKIIDLARPEVIVLPHPSLDPHPDHVCAYQVMTEVLMDVNCHQPQSILCYANHLHITDRWPMGPAHEGVALPPHFQESTVGIPYSIVLNEELQCDKAMALGMMHDLQCQLNFKKRLRRRLQTIFTGRRWPSYGDDEFFRKAVRQHELFWVQKIEGKEDLVS
jgi:hypothetical protein